MNNFRISYWLVVALLIFPIFCLSQNNEKLPGTYYHSPKLIKGYEDVDMAKSKISEIAKNSKYLWVKDLRNNNSFILREIHFLNNDVEIIKGKQKVRLDFTDWIDNHRVYLEEEIAHQSISNYSVVIGKVIKLQIGYNYKLANELAQYFYAIQYHNVSIKLDKKLEEFKPIAEQYKNLRSKPAMKEEQRKLIVQANAMNQQKHYGKAIELYVEAVKLDPVSYPAAYSNIALMQAQLELYDLAIYHMKKYIMLVPEAPDARASQDKIYEWEILMKE